MYKYLVKLESKIGKKRIGKILFNDYYDLKDLYWTLVYTAAFGILAGIGNAIPGFGLGFHFVIFLFVQGFLNNTYLSLIINIIYAKIVDFIKCHRDSGFTAI